MRKCDLKSGYLVVNREGKKAIVLLDTPHKDIIASGVGCEGSKQTWGPLSGFTDDLTSTWRRESDIIQVYGMTCNRDAMDMNQDKRALLYEREERVKAGGWYKDTRDNPRLVYILDAEIDEAGYIRRGYGITCNWTWFYKEDSFKIAAANLQEIDTDDVGEGLMDYFIHHDYKEGEYRSLALTADRDKGTDLSYTWYNGNLFHGPEGCGGHLLFSEGNIAKKGKVMTAKELFEEYEILVKN